MDGDIIAAARGQGLEVYLAAFPDEVIAAIALAETQRVALAALKFDPQDAP